MAIIWKRSAPFRLFFFLLLFVAGCSNGHTGPGVSAGPGSFDFFIYLGDAPADGVVDFTMTVSKIQLVSGNNNYVVLSNPVTLEFSRNSGAFLPVSIADNILGGPFTSAIITVASPQVIVLNPTTGMLQTLTPTLQSSTITVNLTNSITVNSDGGGIV